tara:strand:- start:1461 stop:3209 length:1749 start_codon:yes stop_codon:yes gene_type:complete
MAISDDISVAVNGDIRYTGAAHAASGAGYYTVIDFHRFIQDLADDAVATGDDLLDITGNTPSNRSTDNIITMLGAYNIDQTLAEHLFDGSIIQGTGGTQEVWDGLVVIAAEGMDLQIIQDGAQEVNDFWNTVPFGESEKGLNRDVANGISHRFMFKVVAAGTDTDGRRIIGTTRVIGSTFSEFKVNGTARGNNVLALTFATDLNDTTDASTRSTITNTEGYRLLDIDNNTANEAYYSEWNVDTYTINQFYERAKYLSRGEASNAGTLYGIDAKIFRGITHEVDVSGGSGTWVEPESLSWGTGATAGTGQLLAVDDTVGTSSTKLWMQLLTGVAPSANTITGNGAATGTAGTVLERTISTPFVGVSTGSALIGSYGLGMEVTDVAATDKLFDLTNSQITPPNNVTFTVSGLEIGEDRVLVGPKSTGTTLETGQYALNAGITSGATSLVVKVGTGAVPETPGTGTNSEVDTPSTGTIRVADNSGVFQRVTYTGFSAGAGTMTFTGLTGAPTASVDNDVFISFIDLLATGASEAFTAVYSADRNLFIRVRDAGTAGDLASIKTFETGGTLGSGGGSTSAIRTSDE